VNTFDLAKTYVSLDGKGHVATHELTREFWQTIAHNKSILGTMIGVYPMTEDWPHWEMHPKGDELLVMLDGELTLILDQGGRESRVKLEEGEAFLVPAGAWHRALVPRPGRLLGVTFGEGTEHRPL
jgi:mannose-6-phosphate isomerase-like protein (cupin superfamily)